MDCRVLRALTLKSDGHFSCDDSNGYSINLGEASTQPKWRIKKVLDGALYRHVRDSLARGRVPWPGFCDGCDCLSLGAPSNDTLDRRIDLRLEPTLSCSLSCLSCKRKIEASERRGSWFLDPALLKSVLRSCRAIALDVPRIFYLGWGEPLENSKFRELVEIGRVEMPKAIHHLTTNGNVDFRAAVGSTQLDQIIVSCDGVRQESYEKYRVGGDVRKALNFMRDARIHAHGRPFIEWKYILFEFNDSEDELLSAQKMADDMGVDALVFIITNSKRRSRRFTLSQASSTIPLVSRLASVAPAAAFQKKKAVGQLILEPAAVGKLGNWYIDSCFLTESNMVTLEGWALDSNARYVKSVELREADRLLTRAYTIHERVDVQKAIPNAEGPRCGFLLRAPINLKGDRCDFELGLVTESEIERFPVSFRFVQASK